MYVYFVVTTFFFLYFNCLLILSCILLCVFVNDCVCVCMMCVMVLCVFRCVCLFVCCVCG